MFAFVVFVSVFHY